jgi:hypothetical protein
LLFQLGFLIFSIIFSYQLDKYRHEKHDAQPSLESTELPHQASIPASTEPVSVTTVQQLDTGAVCEDVDAENMITPTATNAPSTQPSLLAPLKTHTLEPAEAVPDLFDELESDSDSLFQSGGISNLLSSLTSTWAHKQSTVSKSVSDYAVSFAVPSSSSSSHAAPTPVQSESTQSSSESTYQSTYVGSRRPLSAAVFSSDTINALQRFTGPVSPQYDHREDDSAIETNQPVIESVEQVVVIDSNAEITESIVQSSSPVLQDQNIDHSVQQIQQPLAAVAEVIEPVEQVSYPEISPSDLSTSPAVDVQVAEISSQASEEQVQPSDVASVNVADVTDRLQATIARLAQETDDLRSQNERLETQNQFLAMELKTSDKRVGFVNFGGLCCSHVFNALM